MSLAIKSLKEAESDAREKAAEYKAISEKIANKEAMPEDIQRADVLEGEIKALSEHLEKAATLGSLKTLNRLENTLADLGQPDRPRFGGHGDGAGHDGVGTGRDGRIHAVEVKTAGEQFLQDDNFRRWLDAVAPNGNMPNQLSTTSPTIEVKALYTLAGDSTASRPLLGQADRRTEMVQLGWPLRVVRDLVTNLTTNSDLVEDIRELARTNNAAFVEEATATSGSSGEKPESGFTFEVIQCIVQTVAHWIPASTRVLSDARRLEGLIDAFLREGLEQAVEAALLTGSGTSPVFRGINNTTGILTQAYATSGLATTRKARTKLMVTGREARPNAWLFHPNDWETLDLTMDGENRFYFGGPLAMGTPRLWGIPVTESEFQTEGAPLLGNFRQAVIYDREQTGVRMSTQHMDFFIRNLIAILAEMRLAFNVRRPSSFVSVDVVP